MRTLYTILACLLCAAAAPAQTPSVTPLRCPNDGIQPQAVVDSAGRIHLIYLKGSDAASDIYYIRSDDAAKIWSAPLRVNSQEGAAIAVGTVRGPHLALGKNDRPHVAWMGSQSAQPRGPNGATPMLYTRLSDAGNAFEPQRNLITTAPGLDGGGSIAAAAQNVVVAWHAPIPGQKGEENRTVWVTASQDQGKTFTPEMRLADQPTGACGCCGMRATLDAGGDFVALFRGASGPAADNRDMYLLHLGRGAANKFVATRLHELRAKTCPMSTMSFARAADETTLIAWETAAQVHFARVDPRSREIADRVAPPGESDNRKHPSLAAGNGGHTLLAWSEGTAWKRGGSVAWQLFDARTHKPITGASGTQNGLPVWSAPSAIRAKGGFLIFY